jgi:hypothetical protein
MLDPYTKGEARTDPRADRLGRRALHKQEKTMRGRDKLEKAGTSWERLGKAGKGWEKPQA